MGLFKKIEYTKILSTSSESQKQMGSSIAKGIVGGALFGLSGTIAGASSGKVKTKTKTKFLVVYTDGSKTTMDVDNDSVYYDTFIKYLKDE